MTIFLNLIDIEGIIFLKIFCSANFSAGADLQSVTNLFLFFCLDAKEHIITRHESKNKRQGRIIIRPCLFIFCS